MTDSVCSDNGRTSSHDMSTKEAKRRMTMNEMAMYREAGNEVLVSPSISASDNSLANHGLTAVKRSCVP